MDTNKNVKVRIVSFSSLIVIYIVIILFAKWDFLFLFNDYLLLYTLFIFSAIIYSCSQLLTSILLKTHNLDDIRKLNVITCIECVTASAPTLIFMLISKNIKLYFFILHIAFLLALIILSIIKNKGIVNLVYSMFFLPIILFSVSPMVIDQTIVWDEAPISINFEDLIPSKYNVLNGKIDDSGTGIFGSYFKQYLGLYNEELGEFYHCEFIQVESSNNFLLDYIKSKYLNNRCKIKLENQIDAFWDGRFSYMIEQEDGFVVLNTNANFFDNSS